MAEPELRELLMAQGASAADLAWFDSIGWNDAHVPAATTADVGDYERREKLLNASTEGLTFAERGTSAAGRLAAAIGARIADLRDSEEAD